MDESETTKLLREIPDLLAGQEHMLTQHLARIEESNQRWCVRSEETYERQFEKSRRQNRIWMISNFLYLFFTVMIAAAIGARWGR